MNNLKDLFEKHEAKIFLIFQRDGKTTGESYGQFYDRCGRLKSELKKRQWREGSLIGFQPDNSVESVAFLFVLASMNLTPVLFSRRMPQAQLQSLWGEKIFFTTHQVRDLGAKSGETLAAPSSDVDVPLQSSLVFWTSGTSSKPKAAVLRLSNFYFNAVGSSENIPFNAGDHWLLKLPVEHVGGLAVLFRALLNGGTVILDSDQNEVLSRVTHLSFVSTQLYRFLNSPAPEEPIKQNQLKAVLLGGGPIPQELIEKSLDRGLPIFKSYGMTEMASQITTTKPGATRDELFTSGRGLTHREIKIEDGIILVKGPCLFAGYLNGNLNGNLDGNLNGQVEVLPAVDGQGWFKTKDLGRWSPQGLQVLGRADRMFISAGENIQPELIEQALLEIPGVMAAKVVPLDDSEYGKRPLAFIRTTRVIEREAINKHLKEKLSGLQIPKEILNWESLPESLKTAKDL